MQKSLIHTISVSLFLQIYCISITFGQFIISRSDKTSGLVSYSSIGFETVLNHFDVAFANELVSQYIIEPGFQKSVITDPFNNSVWEVELIKKREAIDSSRSRVSLTLVLLSDSSSAANAGLQMRISNWKASNYLLMPGSTYNGNRFESRRIRYSPKLNDTRDISPEKGMIISDIPRLNIDEGPSEILGVSGTSSIPSIGYYNPDLKEVTWIFFSQGNRWGDYGVNIRENNDRTVALFSLMSPLVREKKRYRICDNAYPSSDHPAIFRKGDSIAFSIEIIRKKVQNLQSIFDIYCSKINEEISNYHYHASLPFSKAFRIIEKKFNNANFVSEYGYYSVGLRSNFLQDWQIGWTGGMISTLPLLQDGNETSRQNVLRNFDWLFPNGISKSGYFYDSGEQGTKWYEGDIRYSQTKNWHLIRKSGDGLWFVLQQFEIMEKKGLEVKQEWKNGTKRVAETFVRTWKKWNQLGQFVNSETGDVIVGGSTSAAIVPAALIKASTYFGEEIFAKTAIEIAQSLYQNYVLKGITCGGPGDAMQNPDSESAYALLESLISLYEYTKDPAWIQKSIDMGKQMASWIMVYDYKFPVQSEFGKLGIHTAGTVFANTQNRHPAPGFCTYSGNALLRLYRYSDDPFFAKLLRMVTCGLTQYLSTSDHPVAGMPEGWMSERINTSDWFEGTGEPMKGSTWAETTTMLTYSDVPGIYLCPEKNELFIFDNANASLDKQKDGKSLLKIKNPSPFKCTYKIMIESKDNRKNPVSREDILNWKKVSLDPGEELRIKL